MGQGFDQLLNSELIRSKRREDPVLNEVCLDFQVLADELESLSGNRTPSAALLAKDLKATLEALENEILDRVAK